MVVSFEVSDGGSFAVGGLKLDGGAGIALYYNTGSGRQGAAGFRTGEGQGAVVFVECGGVDLGFIFGGYCEGYRRPQGGETGRTDAQRQ